MVDATREGIIVDEGLGQNAPDFELLNHRQENVCLSDYWTTKPVLLIFLRHLGCPLCREHISRIRSRFDEMAQAGIQIVAVTMGNAKQAAEFRESQDLPCDVLADPDRKAYVGYGLERRGVDGVANPKMWWAGLCSLVRYGAGRPIGDIWQMPGAFLIGQRGEIRHAHRSQHSGDLESYDEVLKSIR